MIAESERSGDNIRIVYPETRAYDVQQYVEDQVKELQRYGHEYEDWAFYQLKRISGNKLSYVPMTIAGTLALLGALYMNFYRATMLDQLVDTERFKTVILFLDMVLIAAFCLYQGLIKPVFVNVSYKKAENTIIDVIQTRIYCPEGKRPVSRQECLDWLMCISGLKELQHGNGSRIYLRFTDFMRLVDDHRYELFCGLEEIEGCKYLLSLEELNALEESDQSVQYLYPSIGYNSLIFRQSRRFGDGEYYIHATERQIHKIEMMNKDRGNDAFVVDLTFYDDIFKCIHANSYQEAVT